MVNINKYIKVLLHPAGVHQGSHKAHQAGNHSLIHPNVGKVHMLHIRKGIGHNKLVRVHSFACLYQPKHRWWHVWVMGIPPPAPLPRAATTSSMTKFPNVSCDRVVWRWLTRHDLPSRPEKISSELDDRDLARGGGVARPYRCSGKVPVVELRRDFFWTQVRREGNTYRQANTRSHFGPCNSLRCEMAPSRDWTSLTYIWPLSVEGDLPLKYRSREISSKQYGAGQYQQMSDVFLKQGRSFL